MLTVGEIERIQVGLTDLSAFGPKMMVSFQTRALSGATVVWLNRRWFFERSIDVSDSATAVRVRHWLIATFAYLVPQPNDPIQAYTERTKTFFADRYGSSRMARHGGSGRVGTFGCFQVKGIGPTPLVGKNINWTHSHGCAWMEESIREAIFAELACAEFPYGAVPVIAIIDTGLNHHADSQEVGERRALIVRPAILRFAHFQRAPMFRAKERQQVMQLDDAERTRDVVQTVAHLAAKTQRCKKPVWIEHAIKQIAAQIAFGQVHRISYGGYFSSNLSLQGELLDYGAMRAVPDWTSALLGNESGGFGQESRALTAVIESFVFYYNKYRPDGFPPCAFESLLEEALSEVDRCFAVESTRVWGLTPQDDSRLLVNVVDRMRRYFIEQQRQRRRFAYHEADANPSNWIYDAISGISNDSAERQVFDEMILLLQKYLEPDRVEAALQTAARLTRPRSELSREHLQSVLFDQIVFHRRAQAPDVRQVDDCFANFLSVARRHWPHLPPHLVVRAQVSNGFCNALRCESYPGSRSVLWIETVANAGRVRMFDVWIDRAELQAHCKEHSETHWHGEFPLDSFDPQHETTLWMGNQQVTIPAMKICYSWNPQRPRSNDSAVEFAQEPSSVSVSV